MEKNLLSSRFRGGLKGISTPDRDIGGVNFTCMLFDSEMLGLDKFRCCKAGPYGRSIFNYLTNLHVYFNSRFPSLHFQLECIRISNCLSQYYTLVKSITRRMVKKMWCMYMKLNVFSQNNLLMKLYT